MTRLVLVLLVACGGKQPAPEGSPPFDAPALAAELDGELAEVARILHDHREDCPRMASELRAVFARMTASLARAREAQQDPERARQLTTAMRTYDAAAGARMQQIEADFSVDAPCANDANVRSTMLSMPSL
ncbi:MAG: hypothetical protein SFX73_39990 [Kofleriaceae bacterium]|nr:hypothetical protein [Kofleriaceae bacterium]